MVVSLDPQDSINLVTEYFKSNLKNFKLIKSTYYTGYWWLEFVDKEDTMICFDGDIGGSFYIKVIIDGTEYCLWQYNRSVNQASQSTKENILYQLNVLKSFLDDKSRPT